MGQFFELVGPFRAQPLAIVALQRLVPDARLRFEPGRVHTSRHRGRDVRKNEFGSRGAPFVLVVEADPNPCCRCVFHPVPALARLVNVAGPLDLNCTSTGTR